VREERSGSGEPVYRYDDPTPTPAASDVPKGWHEALDAHCEQFFGPDFIVVNDSVGQYVHVDVCVHAPTSDRDFWTLRTAGASDLEMTRPEGADVEPRIELVTYVPRTWDMKALEGGLRGPLDELVRWLTFVMWELGRFPQEYGTWLGSGHTVDMSAVAPDVSGWRFNRMLLVEPIWEVPACQTFSFGGESCSLLWVLPLTDAEAQVKLATGVSDLFALMETRALGHVFDPDRPCVVTGHQVPERVTHSRRRWFGRRHGASKTPPR